MIKTISDRAMIKTISDRATVNTDDSCPPNSLDELPALLPNLQTKLPEKKEKMVKERT